MILFVKADEIYRFAVSRSIGSIWPNPRAKCSPMSVNWRYEEVTGFRYPITLIFPQHSKKRPSFVDLNSLRRRVTLIHTLRKSLRFLQQEDLSWLFVKYMISWLGNLPIPKFELFYDLPIYIVNWIKIATGIKDNMKTTMIRIWIKVA